MFNFLNKLPKSFIKKPLAHRGFHDCNGSFTKGSGLKILGNLYFMQLRMV